MKVSELLFEATFNVDEVVDLIYDEVYADFIDNIQRFKKGGILTPEDIKLDNKVYSWESLVNKLEDEKIKDAVAGNRIETHAGVNSTGSSYRPGAKTVIVSFNYELYDSMLGVAAYNGESYKDMMNRISPRLWNMAEQEFNGNKVRATIAHEFSHLLGDFYHGEHLTKQMGKVAQAYKDDLPRKKIDRLMNRGHADQYQTDYEIDAITHGLKQLKRSLGKEKWDSLSFNQMIQHDAGLNTVIERLKQLHGKEESKFFKTLFKRMRREDLIGKQMTGNIRL